MSRKKILLVGAGGHAKSCIDVIEQEGKFEIAGLIIPDLDTEKNVLNYPFVGTDNDLENLKSDYDYALISVGFIKSPDNRISLYHKLKDIGFILPSIISSHAYVSSHSEIGEGTIVMHGVIINAGSIVGENCIVNSNALLEHDVVVGSQTHISTGVIINGDVNIGCGVFIGSNTTVKNGVNIEDNCTIGFGNKIRNDLNEKTYMGTPPTKLI